MAYMGRVLARCRLLGLRQAGPGVRASPRVCSRMREGERYVSLGTLGSQARRRMLEQTEAAEENIVASPSRKPQLEGALYEAETVLYLNTTGFDVRQSGLSADKGIDFRGWWRPQAGAACFAVIGQVRIMQFHVVCVRMQGLQCTP